MTKEKQELQERKAALVIAAIKLDQQRNLRGYWGKWEPTRRRLAEAIMHERDCWDIQPSSADYDAAYRLIRAYKALGVKP